MRVRNKRQARLLLPVIQCACVLALALAVHLRELSTKLSQNVQDQLIETTFYLLLDLVAFNTLLSRERFTENQNCAPDCNCSQEYFQAALQ